MYSQASIVFEYGAVEMVRIVNCIVIVLYRMTHKKGELLKTQQKLKKSKKKNLLTEIEPLQLAF